MNRKPLIVLAGFTATVLLANSVICYVLSWVSVELPSASFLWLVNSLSFMTTAAVILVFMIGTKE